MELSGKTKEEGLLQEKVAASKEVVEPDLTKEQEEAQLEDVGKVKAGLQEWLNRMCRERAGLAAHWRQQMEERMLAERSQATGELDNLLGENHGLRKRLQEAEVQVAGTAGARRILRSRGRCYRIETLVNDKLSWLGKSSAG